MNIAPQKLQLADDELALLEQMNPKLKLRVLENAAEAPLSFPQRRVWLTQQTHPGAQYNEQLDLRIEGRLNVSCLEAAWNQIVLQNQPLRTAIVQVDAEPHQRVLPYTPAELSLVDLSRFDDPFREAKRRCIELGNTHLDLPCADVVRACLFKLADEDHIFHVTVHHIAIDDWSWNVLKRDLKRFYEEALAGRLGVLRVESKPRYTEFARLQREQRDAKQLSYWKMQLHDAPVPLELPADHPRPNLPNFRGRREPVSFGCDLAESLKRFSRQRNHGLFTTLLAAFNILLWRYTGSEDLVVGTSVLNRSREHRDAIGCFVNLLPLRTFISGELTANEVVERVRKTVAGAYANENLPFEQVVEDLAPVRVRTHNPFFGTALLLQDASGEIRAVGELSVTELQLDYGWSKYDLSLNFAATASGLSGWIEYSTALFEAATVRRVASHLDVLLMALPQMLDRKIWELPLLTFYERNQFLIEWNQTEMDFPKDKCVHELFEERARESPDADAVVFKRTAWKYREVNARADGVARRLREAKIAAGGLVGVCVERSAEMVAVLLGVWKAGCAYVPLDPTHPLERIKDICRDACVSALITNKDFAPTLAQTNVCTLCVEDIPDAPQAISSEPLSFSSEDLAYVIYTSGSTGKPKGVQIRHRSVANTLAGIAKKTSFTKDNHLLAVTTITFDISVLELFLPLTTGAKVTIVPREVLADGVKLAQLAERSVYNVMQATPATWRMLLEAGWRGNPRLTVFCGGEGLADGLSKELLKRAEAVWNFYGPTKTTVWSTCWKVEKGERISIGTPLGNTQTYILDKYLQPVPVGVVGELYIGGEGLAAGYLHRPELTAEKFVPNPFDRRKAIYQTGDLARYLPEGQIECLGRIDQQVKIRGYRIEPGEIEAVLTQHSAVRQSVVVAADDISGTKFLAAYVVKDRAELGSAELIQYLQSKLPLYMVPTHVVFVEKLPLTSSGKIDRKQLPKLSM